MADESAVASSSESCLSEDDALAFASGRLSPERRERLHRHLDACEPCQRILNEAAHALAAERGAEAVGTEQIGWNTTFRPGMIVGGRYVIRRFIARGGMGEVYEAFDQELMQRVALKTVTSTACDNPSAVRRLKAEVQIARRVSHPNVCRIYDFGTHLVPATGAHLSFLTMEFVDGETLGARIRRDGPLPVSEARALGRELLRGLAAAHDAGVLHRDFKTDNVILRREGKKLLPSILDFGLARALDQDAPPSSHSSRGLVGTLAYIAPDQLEGQPYTTASDVYSFGLVWFEMLTGELPFKSRSSPAITTLDRLTRTVPSPSSQNPEVPRDLDTVVLACLRRSPTERLRTAGQVLARLDELELEARRPKSKFKRWPFVLSVAAALSAVSVPLLVEGRLAPSIQRIAKRTFVAPTDTPTPLHVLVASATGATGEVPPAPPPSPSPAQPAQPPKFAARAALPPAASRRPAPPPSASNSAGWENPFAVLNPSSAELGAVLDQSLDGRAPPGHAQFPESGR